VLSTFAFLGDAEFQVSAGLVVSFLTLILVLLTRNARAVVLSSICTAAMAAAALDLMTDNLVLVCLAEFFGVGAFLLMLASFVFIWQRRANGAIGHLFASAFFGLMTVNLGIERFSSRSEWWYNFQTFEVWMTAATLFMLIPAIIVAVRVIRQVASSLGVSRRTRKPQAQPAPGRRPADTRSGA
jgi:hypothetical protein